MMYLSYSQIKKREISSYEPKEGRRRLCVTQLYRSPGPLPTRPWGVLTELVSYMYPIYVHYMYILDVLSFPFGSRH